MSMVGSKRSKMEGSKCPYKLYFEEDIFSYFHIDWLRHVYNWPTSGRRKGRFFVVGQFDKMKDISKKSCLSMVPQGQLMEPTYILEII